MKSTVSLEAPVGVIGVDEAGRGPLAGPIVVAAVIFPESGCPIAGLNDSKQLKAQAREEFADQIRATCTYAIEYSWPEEIDRLNVFWATMAAMERAVASLQIPTSKVLIDGNQIPRGLRSRAEAVVKGDSKIAQIAAASILAKTERDAYMVRIAEKFPGYGFESHFGYPTPPHFATLEALGPCEIHRRSYAPVAAAYERLGLPLATAESAPLGQLELF